MEDRLCLSLAIGLTELQGAVGSPFTSQVSISGTNVGDNVVYSVETPPGSPPATDLPPGITIDSATGQLSGIPTTPGSFPVIIKVADQTLDETVSEAFPLSISPEITLSGEISGGAEYSDVTYDTITASGPTKDTYTFSASGNLPTGLTIAPVDGTTAQLQGAPTQWGTFTFTVTATDPEGYAGKQTFSMTISPLMTFSPTPIADVYYTNDDGTTVPFLNSLPVAEVGQDYSQTIQVTSGQTIAGLSVSSQDDSEGTGFTWNNLTVTTDLAAGQVTITGVPSTFTTEGAFSDRPSAMQLTVTATDSAGDADSVTYDLSVEPDLTAPSFPIEAQVPPTLRSTAALPPRSRNTSPIRTRSGCPGPTAMGPACPPPPGPP